MGQIFLRGRLIFVFLFMIGFACGQLSSVGMEAKVKDEKVRKIEKQEGNKNSDKLSTSLSFEDLLVQGTYHFSDEAVATVEEDKVLDSLLVIRKDFKDRIKRSASRY
ncbi:MAG: hypothetical protein IPJ71_07650 [Bdellovibrionales bacterium]|nr:hypothetical protein [Bdellovibrionales bacterium]